MPTFAALRDDLRNEILVEDDPNFHSPDNLLRMLIDASIEVATAGGFPTATSSISVSLSASSVTAPSDLLTVEPRGFEFEGLTLSPASLQKVKLYKKISGPPRFYHHDPKSGGNIDFGPIADETGTVVLKYVQSLSSSVSAGASPWGGVLSQFADVVKLRAAVKAFGKGFEGDMMQLYSGLHNQRLQELAAFLGNSDLLRLLVPVQTGSVPGEARNVPGSAN